MALRLSAWLGTSPDLWLDMQTQWDLWQAEQRPYPHIKTAGKAACVSQSDGRWRFADPLYRNLPGTDTRHQIGELRLIADILKNYI
ncbi:MAG: hypothetical protein OEX82_00175 [Nitrosomonas sp.]|nr:hypothetical protein [Nitrosomonas sp.]